MITFESVTKLYGTGAAPALDDVSLDIAKGEFVFLVGPSGSGKSTFVRLCLGEEPVTSGRVFVLGKNIAEVSQRRMPMLRREIGTVFQDFRLLEDKDVYDNVALAMQVVGAPRRQIRTRVPEILDMVGLDGKERRMINELSGGEQQRVAIARAMVNQPKLLFADEPTGNLDPDTTLGIMSLLDRINRKGTTVVMATHAVDTVNQMRKRVVALKRGRVMSDQQRGIYGKGSE